MNLNEPDAPIPQTAEVTKNPAGQRVIVLVGLMGAGKTTIGRRLAARLGVPFIDADAEIETAAGMSISEIFEKHGEAHFREGERRVIERLLRSGAGGVLATGGGAFIDPQTRLAIARHGVSVWLRADVELLLKRVQRRNTRPLLKQGDPREIMEKLRDQRYPIYALADIVTDSVDTPHDAVVDDIVAKLTAYFAAKGGGAMIPTGGDEKIRVDLGVRAYDIHVGAGPIGRAGALLKPLLRRGRVVVVTDRNVAQQHLPALLRALDASAIAHAELILPPGEQTKDFEHLQLLLDWLLDQKIERGDLVLALGGGVIGDLAGFAASILLRGVDFVQIPTTLLAQVDSSVGGKTGINTRHGKNLIGAFHQPRMVIADIGLLASLPQRELLAGYAEVVKYGLIGDALFFEWLETAAPAILARDVGALTRAVLTSCKAKAAIVSADERESGPRALLNLGHTFGHALERETGYGERLLHGEAVAIGICLAFEVAAQIGLAPRQDAQRVTRHLSAIGLPARIADIAGPPLDCEKLLAHMTQDKKVTQGRINFVLPRRIGDCFITDQVDLQTIGQALKTSAA